MSKALDALHGAEREVVGFTDPSDPRQSSAGGRGGFGVSRGEVGLPISVPATPDAVRWSGYGTALKPSIEPAILARKPLSESSIARNVLRWGTGALNIDGCRYAFGDPAWPGPQEQDDTRRPGNQYRGHIYGDGVEGFGGGHDLGRFPANVFACAKTNRGERERGCAGLPTRTGAEAVDRQAGTAGLANPRAGAGRTAGSVGNHHPT